MDQESILQSLAEQTLFDSGRAYDSRYIDSIVGTFVYNGRVYNVQGDGSFTTISETPDQVVTTTTFTPTGQEVGTYVDDRFQTSTLDRILEAGANGLITAGLAAGLGPAGVGLLSAPLATSVAAGSTSLLGGGSVQDALTAAAVGGLGALGTEQLLGVVNNASFDASFAAADAAQLANQGLSATQIAQNLSTYVDPALATSLANTAANSAFALADANQLVAQGLNADQVTQVLQASGLDATVATNVAQAAAEGVTQISASDIVPNLNFQPQTGQSTQVATSPNAVEVTAQRLPDVPAVGSTGAGLLSSAVTTTPTPTPAASVAQPAASAPTQQVEVTSQPATTQQVAPEVLAALVPGYTDPTPGPTQTVQVSDNRILPEDLPNRSVTEKAQLYNSLISQGLTDQQVRVIAEREFGPGATQGWEYLTAAADALRAPTAPTQQVEVTSQPVQQTSTPETTGGLLSGAVAPTQTVPVTAQPVVTQPAVTTPETTGGLLSGAVLPTQTVPVTAQPAANTTSSTSSDTGAVVSSLVPSVPTQSVNVTGQTITDASTTPSNAGSAASAAVGSNPVQTVDVTGTRESNLLPTTVGSVVASIPASITNPLPTPTQPATRTPEGSLFTPNDLLKLLTLIGGLGVGAAAGSGSVNVPVGGVPPSDPRIGSTTPQFGDDYYAAIQRYYNSYMPQYPRDVATPLQQWYENKFGETSSPAPINVSTPVVAPPPANKQGVMPVTEDVFFNPYFPIVP